MADTPHTVILRQRQDFQFDIDFGAGKPLLLGDEGPPLGQGAGPSPVQLLAAAVGNCMADSLHFALRKFKHDVHPLACHVTPQVGRNEQQQLRVLALHVELTLGVPAQGLTYLGRALDQFEAFCTVGASVRQGIPVQITVRDVEGTVLKA